MTSRHWASAIVAGGLTAGSIDIGAACLINWQDPVFICHAIAAGLLGIATSFQGGAVTAACGALLQWGMSLVIAALYVGASRLIPMLKRWWLAGGLAYGVGIFVVMNYVVVPLSAISRFPSFTPDKAAENLGAMLLFGTIVAWFARAD